MSYWCYFLTIWTKKIIEQITEKNIITFPRKFDCNPNDVVVIYYKNGYQSGFVGFVKLNSTVIKNKQNMSIFDDKNMNCFVAQVSNHKLFENPVKRSIIFLDNDMNKKIGNILRKNDYLRTIPTDMGIHIKKYFRNNTDNATNIKQKSKKVEIKVIKPEKSDSLIPIAIVPCEEFLNNIKTVNADDKIQWIFDHIVFCKKCDVTNNNDRITFDMIFDKIIDYDKFTELDDIDDLIDAYHNVDYYQKLKIKVNHIKIIKINNKLSEYHKCYFIVGKLDFLI